MPRLGNRRWLPTSQAKAEKKKLWGKAHNVALEEAEEQLASLCGHWKDNTGSSYWLERNRSEDSTLDVVTTRPSGETIKTRALISIDAKTDPPEVIWGRGGRAYQFTIARCDKDSIVWQRRGKKPFEWYRVDDASEEEPEAEITPRPVEPKAKAHMGARRAQLRRELKEQRQRLQYLEKKPTGLDTAEPSVDVDVEKSINLPLETDGVIGLDVHLEANIFQPMDEAVVDGCDLSEKLGPPCGSTETDPCESIGSESSESQSKAERIVDIRNLMDLPEWMISRYYLSWTFEIWAQCIQDKAMDAEGRQDEQQQHGLVEVGTDADLDSRGNAASPQASFFRIATEAPNQCLDSQIVETLAASTQVHERLGVAQEQVNSVFEKLRIARSEIIYYGSLSFGRSREANVKETSPTHEETPYITEMSDVDVATFAPDQAGANALVDDIMRLGDGQRWRSVSSVNVPMFAVSQWTLMNDAGAQLDLTCISDRTQFGYFAKRQEVFRQLFWQARRDMIESFGSHGEKSFDAYIYLLKGFACCASRSVLTSFQAVCLGLYVLGFWRTTWRQFVGLTPPVAPSALELFRCFLLFCHRFYGSTEDSHSHKTHAIDIMGKRLIPKVNDRPRAELYFVEVEENLGPPRSKWMNVLHRLDPDSLHNVVGESLANWYTMPDPWNLWLRMSQDMKRHLQCADGAARRPQGTGGIDKVVPPPR